MLYNGKPFPENDEGLDRFDGEIARQAAYYGMTVAQHKRFLDEVCELQERAEFEQWEAM